MHSVPSSLRPFAGVVSDFAPSRSVPIAAPKPATDLLAEAARAYQAEQDAALGYREIALANAFRARFGVEPERPHFWRRSTYSKTGVWTFKAAGLAWKGGEDGSGDERYCWFAVCDVRGSWHQASSKAQLGQLLADGVQLGQLPDEAA